MKLFSGLRKKPDEPQPSPAGDDPEPAEAPARHSREAGERTPPKDHAAADEGPAIREIGPDRRPLNRGAGASAPSSLLSTTWHRH